MTTVFDLETLILVRVLKIPYIKHAEKFVNICQTELPKSNFKTRPKKRIFRSAGHWWSWKFFLANFQILGPLGCQGWVFIPQNVKKVKITAPYCTVCHIFQYRKYMYSVHTVQICKKKYSSFIMFTSLLVF